VEIAIRTGVRGDVFQIAAVHHRASEVGYSHIFDHPLPVATLASTWQRRLATPGIDVLVAERVGFGVVGVIAIRRTDDPRVAECFGLYVAPDVWSLGVGTTLVWAAVEFAPPETERIGAWVLEDNERGRRFWHGRGFELVPERVLVNPGGAREVRYERVGLAQQHGSPN
jgi:GNAT superfamily N-acetyltransferase